MLLPCWAAVVTALPLFCCCRCSNVVAAALLLLRCYVASASILLLLLCCCVTGVAVLLLIITADDLPLDLSPAAAITSNDLSTSPLLCRNLFVVVLICCYLFLLLLLLVPAVAILFLLRATAHIFLFPLLLPSLLPTTRVVISSACPSSTVAVPSSFSSITVTEDCFFHCRIRCGNLICADLIYSDSYFSPTSLMISQNHLLFYWVWGSIKISSLTKYWVFCLSKSNLSLSLRIFQNLILLSLGNFKILIVFKEMNI